MRLKLICCQVEAARRGWHFDKVRGDLSLLQKLVDGLHAMGTRVRLHICGNTRFCLAQMGQLGCKIVDLDFPSPVAEGRAKMGPRQILLGNVNPVTVLRGGTPAGVIDAISRCRRDAGTRYIIGAGCEIPRDTVRAKGIGIDTVLQIEEIASTGRTNE